MNALQSPDYIRLFITAIIPGIALSIGLYIYDRYDREPVKLLFKLFFFGILIAAPTIIVERLLSYGLVVFTGIGAAAYNAFIIAGITEEFFKRYVVLKFAYNSPSYNEKLDGIIYCCFAALGFATIENILYVVFTYSANPAVGYLRGVLSVPAHTLFAVTMGYYLSLARFCPDPHLRESYLSKSLFVPAVLHGTFNFILMANVPFLMIFFIPFLIYLWVVNLRKLKMYLIESRTEQRHDERFKGFGR